MIVPARRSAPRSINYRRVGVWPGMGAFDPPARPVWIDPGYPPDPGIVAQNTRNNDAYQVAMAGAQAQNNLDQCRANADNANSPEQRAAVLASCGAAYANAGAYASGTADTPVSWYGGGGSAAPFSGSTVRPAAAATGVPARGGQLTFTTSRGGTSLQVGDTWSISISGATPNAPVTVSGSMPGSSFSGTSMGSTDGSGNFSKSGTLDSSTVGAWQEFWAVGGAPSGSFSFTVAPATTPAGQTIINSSGAQSAPGGSFTLPTVGGFDLSKVPWWGWLAAGGAALWMMSGSGGGSRRNPGRTNAGPNSFRKRKKAAYAAERFLSEGKGYWGHGVGVPPIRKEKTERKRKRQMSR